MRLFSISNTINVNNAIKNIPDVNGTIKSSLLISITALLKRGTVMPVAYIQLLNYTVELYHNYVECIHKNKMEKTALTSDTENCTITSAN